MAISFPLDSEVKTLKTITELDISDIVKKKKNKNIEMNCGEDKDNKNRNVHDAEINDKTIFNNPTRITV